MGERRPFEELYSYDENILCVRTVSNFAAQASRESVIDVYDLAMSTAPLVPT